MTYQIFEVVRVVGKLHQLSAGLVTGGRKEFEGEQDRIVKMNILVATPGRLLQVRQQQYNECLCSVVLHSRV
jgi:ATP-dependent RNA helicase DDX10/DBP4